MVRAATTRSRLHHGDRRTNVWHHAAATYDGHLSESTSTASSTAPASHRGATPRGHIDPARGPGFRLRLDRRSADGFFQGAIDEARIWNNARSRAQIAGAMNTEIDLPNRGPPRALGDERGYGNVRRQQLGRDAVRNAVAAPPGSPARLPQSGRSRRERGPCLQRHRVSTSRMGTRAGLGCHASSPSRVDQAARAPGTRRRIGHRLGDSRNARSRSITKGRGGGRRPQRRHELLPRPRRREPAARRRLRGQRSSRRRYNHPVFNASRHGDPDEHLDTTPRRPMTAVDWRSLRQRQSRRHARPKRGATPRLDSIQHFGIGTAMTSTGAAAGFFQGPMDEVRVWNVARSQAQISGSMNAPITGRDHGLLARYGHERGNRTVGGDSIAPAQNGTTSTLPSWTAGAPALDGDVTAPAAPTGLAATAGEGSISLDWNDNGEGDLAGYNVYRGTSSPVSTAGSPLNGGTPLSPRTTSTRPARPARPTSTS